MKIRKTTTAVLCLLLVFSLLTLCGYAESGADTDTVTAETPGQPVYNNVGGSCGAEGSNLTWSFSQETGVLSVTGSGYMELYPNNVPWKNYRSAVKSVVIGEGVKSVSHSAFSEMPLLTSVSLPESLEQIDRYAFYKTGLQTVAIPKNTAGVGIGAFSSCPSLQSIQVSTANANYKSVSGALYSKDGKTLLQVPGTLQGTFTVPTGVTTLSGPVFIGMEGLTGVTIPEGVTCIPEACFSACSALKSVSLPSTLTDISAYAFRYTTSLTAISLPTALKSIGIAAFSGSGLKTLTIPKNVETIAERVVSGCKSLTAVKVASGNTHFVMKNGMLLSADGTRLVCCAGNYPAVAVVPSTVTDIEAYAFAGCTGLQAVVIPGNVTAFKEATFTGCTALEVVMLPASLQNLGNTTFRDCTKLKRICYAGNGDGWMTMDKSNTTIPDSADFYLNTTYQNHSFTGAAAIGICGDNVFWKVSDATGGERVLSLMGTGGTWSFATASDRPDFEPYVGEVTKIHIGSGITSLGISLFEGCDFSLTKAVEMEDTNGVQTIMERAFYGLQNVTSLTLPKTVTAIGDRAFGWWKSLSHVSYSGSGYQWSKVKLTISTADQAAGVPAYYSNRVLLPCILKSGTESGFGWSVTFGGLLTVSGSGSIRDFDLQDAPAWSNYAAVITEVDILPGVTAIGDYAFAELYDAEAVHLPETLKYIGEGAFEGCSKLIWISIPRSVTTIGNEAFENCLKLEAVGFHSGINSWGYDVFDNTAIHLVVWFDASESDYNNLFCDEENMMNSNITRVFDHPCGDASADGLLNSKDLYVASLLLTTSPEDWALSVRLIMDVNGDSRNDNRDLVKLARIVAGIER